MKKLIIPLCSLALVLGMAGVAGALTFTDTQWLLRTYSGVGIDHWYHDTPDGLNVPPDTVNSAYYSWYGCNFMTVNLSTLKINYEKGSVPVPEPETMLMLGSVLLGLVAVSRKRFKTRN